jgi:hypothetical protein
VEQDTLAKMEQILVNLVILLVMNVPVNQHKNVLSVFLPILNILMKLEQNVLQLAQMDGMEIQIAENVLIVKTPLVNIVLPVKVLLVVLLVKVVSQLMEVFV